MSERQTCPACGAARLAGRDGYACPCTVAERMAAVVAARRKPPARTRASGSRGAR